MANFPDLIYPDWLKEVLDPRSGATVGDGVQRKLKRDDVLAVLTELFQRHGPPDHIRSDNGAEFTAHAVRDWLAGSV